MRLALDDFGMGFSSLARLKTFALHTLKIDRMFVTDMLDSDRESAIVRAIVELGHGLGMRVTDRQPSDLAADAPPSGWSQSMSALLTTL